jgi:myo-inositol 2-dehydrogenase/D-chiro-inositol 1-dehydrogenase
MTVRVALIGAGIMVVTAEVAAGRRLVTVGYMRRFDPGYVAMKRALAEGAVGAPLVLHNLHRNVSAGPGFAGWMAIANSAPHEFDAARFRLGEDMAAVAAAEAGVRALAEGRRAEVERGEASGLYRSGGA